MDINLTDVEVEGNIQPGNHLEVEQIRPYDVSEDLKNNILNISTL